jgi:hypothetical protein
MKHREIQRVEDYIFSNVELKSRKREYLYIRYYLMAYLKNKTNFSLSAIGSMIGGKDHATVLHALKTYEDIKNYKDVVSYTEDVRELFPMDSEIINEDLGIQNIGLVKGLQSLENYFSLIQPL